MRHGHASVDERHLELHRIAFQKFRADPAAGKAKLEDVLDRWLADPDLNRQEPLLRQWREALELPPDDLEALIMSDRGQQLRQCSPMGVLISALERFSVYRQARDAEPTGTAR